MREITHKDYADGLRQIADWYEAHPEIALPTPATLGNYMLNTKEEAAQVSRALGTCEKTYTDTMFYISRQFDAVRLEFVFFRNAVCVPRVVGTEDVPERVIPAHTRDIVEWDCSPILGEADGAADAPRLEIPEPVPPADVADAAAVEL